MSTECSKPAFQYKGSFPIAVVRLRIPRQVSKLSAVTRGHVGEDAKLLPVIRPRNGGNEQGNISANPLLGT